MPPLRILVAPDKFKGSLSARQAARSIAAGWHLARPGDAIDLLPITDGGDGFGDAMRRLLSARVRTIQTRDAAGRPCHATWWLDPRSRTAIIESARVIGLSLLPCGVYHPFQLDSSGLANLLVAASRAGARTCLVGLGGSATNDAGFGMARALGWRFLDRAGQVITLWTDLTRLTRIEPPGSNPLGSLKIIAATDVNNPLLGRLGATRIYGPQKGIRPTDMPRANACHARLAAVACRLLDASLAHLPGAGAAGGLGFGLVAFTRATLKPGFALFSRWSKLEPRLKKADLVLTGEGTLDPSTAMGKGVGEISRLARQHHVPCIALAGQIARSKRLKPMFTATHAVVPAIAPLPQALAQPAAYLRKLARLAAVNSLLKTPHPARLPRHR